MSHFFAYLSRMRFIKRWNIMRNVVDENIQEHSLQAAMIAHVLAVLRNSKFGGKLNVVRVLELALYHEIGEVITGDLATPIKYFNPEIRRVFKEIEGMAEQKLLNMLPEELQAEFAPILSPDEDTDEWRVVKAADKICAYLKCVEELKTGNTEFEKAKESTRRAIEALNMPEVDYFMEKFAPSFSLSLDELN